MIENSFVWRNINAKWIPTRHSQNWNPIPLLRTGPVSVHDRAVYRSRAQQRRKINKKMLMWILHAFVKYNSISRYRRHCHWENSLITWFCTKKGANESLALGSMSCTGHAPAYMYRASLYLYEHRTVSTVQRSKRMQNLCALKLLPKIRIYLINRKICLASICAFLFELVFSGFWMA